MSNLIIMTDQSGNGRTRRAALWGDCPRHEIENGAGYYFSDDFCNEVVLTGKYTLTQATQGTFLITNNRHGVAELDANSTTQHQGGQVQKSTGVGAMFAPAADTKMWFDCRILFKDIATMANFFVGLHDIDTTILSSGALVDASNDWIGFKSETTVSTISGTASNNATEETAALAITPVDHDVVTTGAAWMNLGFKVTGTSLVEFFVNGVKSPLTLATYIPTALMTPSIVCQTDGTVDPIVWLDRWECYVLDRRYAQSQP